MGEFGRNHLDDRQLSWLLPLRPTDFVKLYSDVPIGFIAPVAPILYGYTRLPRSSAELEALGNAIPLERLRHVTSIGARTTYNSGAHTVTDRLCNGTTPIVVMTKSDVNRIKPSE